MHVFKLVSSWFIRYPSSETFLFFIFALSSYYKQTSKEPLVQAFWKVVDIDQQQQWSNNGAWGALRDIIKLLENLPKASLLTICQIRSKLCYHQFIISAHLARRTSWWIWWKVLFRSINTTPFRRPLSILTHQLFVDSNRVVRVLYVVLKPDSFEALDFSDAFVQGIRLSAKMELYRIF